MKITQLLLHKLDSHYQNGQRCLRVYLLGSALKSSAFIEKTRTRQWILTLISDPPIETLAEEPEWQWRSWFSVCLFSSGSGHGLMPYLNCTCSTGFYFPVSATTVDYLRFTGLLNRSSPRQRMPPPHVLWKLQKHPNIVHSVPHQHHPQTKRPTPDEVWKLKLSKKGQMITKEKTLKEKAQSTLINHPKEAFFPYFQILTNKLSDSEKAARFSHLPRTKMPFLLSATSSSSAPLLPLYPMSPFCPHFLLSPSHQTTGGDSYPSPYKSEDRDSPMASLPAHSGAPSLNFPPAPPNKMQLQI